MGDDTKIVGKDEQYVGEDKDVAVVEAGLEGEGSEDMKDV